MLAPPPRARRYLTEQVCVMGVLVLGRLTTGEARKVGERSQTRASIPVRSASTARTALANAALARRGRAPGRGRGGRLLQPVPGFCALPRTRRARGPQGR